MKGVFEIRIGGDLAFRMVFSEEAAKFLADQLNDLRKQYEPNDVADLLLAGIISEAYASDNPMEDW